MGHEQSFSELGGPLGVDATGLHILEVTRDYVIEQGLKATTMTAIARQARISRPTLYARYKRIGDIYRDLLARELMIVLDFVYPLPDTVDQLVDVCTKIVVAASENELLHAVIKFDPEVIHEAMYLKLGSTQRYLVRYLTTIIRKLQNNAASRVRTEDPAVLAGMVFATIQSAAITARATIELIGKAAWAEQFSYLIRGYLEDHTAPTLAGADDDQFGFGELNPAGTGVSPDIFKPQPYPVDPLVKHDPYGAVPHIKQTDEPVSPYLQPQPYGLEEPEQPGRYTLYP